MIVVQTENPKFGPSIEKAVETINLWDDSRGWDDEGSVSGTDQNGLSLLYKYWWDFCRFIQGI